MVDVGISQDANASIQLSEASSFFLKKASQEGMPNEYCYSGSTGTITRSISRPPIDKIS